MLPLDVEHVVRGQYEGDRAESRVAADSQTETFVALRAQVENRRWAGVPLCLRIGKPLAAGRYEDSFWAANELERSARLILDAMLGDRSLFTTGAGLDQLWEISIPLPEQPPPIELYAPGSRGPPLHPPGHRPPPLHLPEEDCDGAQLRRFSRRSGWAGSRRSW